MVIIEDILINLAGRTTAIIFVTVLFLIAEKAVIQKRVKTNIT